MSIGRRSSRADTFPGRGPSNRVRLSPSAFIPIVPFTPQDFPPLPKVRQAGGIEVAASLLLTTLAVGTNAVLRDPLYHTLPQQPAPFEYRVPNLLTSTLAPAQPASPGMPPVPLDLDALPPNNWRPTDVQLNLLETTLKPSVAAPFNVDDLSGPLPVQPVPQWQPQRNLLLTAVPFRPLDFGALSPVGRAQDFAPSNTVILTLQQAIPFTPVDFPALPKVIGLTEYKPANLLTGVLLGQTQPFNQLSWPGLTPSKQPGEAAVSANLALLTTPQPQPFNQLDWPPLPVPIRPEPFLIPNTTIRQVAAPAPPNLHKLYYDVSSGRLFWRVSKTANPIEIIPL